MSKFNWGPPAARAIHGKLDDALFEYVLHLDQRDGPVKILYYKWWWLTGSESFGSKEILETNLEVAWLVRRRPIPKLPVHFMRLGIFPDSNSVEFRKSERLVLTVLVKHRWAFFREFVSVTSRDGIWDLPSPIAILGISLHKRGKYGYITVWLPESESGEKYDRESIENLVRLLAWNCPFQEELTSLDIVENLVPSDED